MSSKSLLGPEEMPDILGRQTVCAKEGEGQGRVPGAWDVTEKGRTQVKKGGLMLSQWAVCSVMEPGFYSLRAGVPAASYGPMLGLKWPPHPGALSPFLPAACPDPRLLKLQPSCSGPGQPPPQAELFACLLSVFSRYLPPPALEPFLLCVTSTIPSTIKNEWGY